MVQDDRQLSREVAESTGIRQESPQVFLQRRGAVVGSASHEGVTAEYLVKSVGGLSTIRQGFSLSELWGILPPAPGDLSHSGGLANPGRVSGLHLIPHRPDAAYW